MRSMKMRIWWMKVEDQASDTLKITSVKYFESSCIVNIQFHAHHTTRPSYQSSSHPFEHLKYIQKPRVQTLWRAQSAYQSSYWTRRRFVPLSCSTPPFASYLDVAYTCYREMRSLTLLRYRDMSLLSKLPVDRFIVESYLKVCPIASPVPSRPYNEAHIAVIESIFWAVG